MAFTDYGLSTKDTPAAATKATVTVAAAPTGFKHVPIAVSATIACGTTAQTPLLVQLKDGSTEIAAWAVSAPANGMGGLAIGREELEGLIGSTATAMTLEFSAAGVTDSRQSVRLGYRTVKS
jgi:hypothetical protein